ncbi:DUF6429 family protein [Pelagibaculum spongiae]|uniref:DUF6429 domain-containing protein n=1 Tax=Pelagibaculum spongiae TaxID=2080658 RepID=A0A2V1GWU9_9GAMM|nr:DUF6429 family protein [Pelagibaculum spongiae]PVZ69538.1 hypothetical protein DC094_09460 [Pelagibaculum spongiae]
MEIDQQKIDDAVLALMYLNLHDECRSWKSLDWQAMDRLHQEGLIDNPASKAKSVWLSKEGREKSKALFEQMFCK